MLKTKTETLQSKHTTYWRDDALYLSFIGRMLNICSRWVEESLKDSKTMARRRKTNRRIVFRLLFLENDCSFFAHCSSRSICCLYLKFQLWIVSTASDGYIFEAPPSFTRNSSFVYNFLHFLGWSEVKLARYLRDSSMAFHYKIWVTFNVHGWK